MQTIIYWIPFILASIFALGPKRPGKIFFILAGILIFLIVGLRSEVGGDWKPYSDWIEEVRGVSLYEGLKRSDFGYALLNWIGANGFGGVYFVNLVCAALATVCLTYFCWRLPNPGLALAVAIPYLVTVVFMGYTRQSVAIGFGMLAMIAIYDRRIWAFLLYVTLAVMFHRTAVVLFTLAPALFAASRISPSIGKVSAIGAFGALLTMLLFWDSAGSLLRSYVWATGDAVSAIPEAPLTEQISELSRAEQGSGVPPTVQVPEIASTEQTTRDAANGMHSSGALFRISQSVVAALAFVMIASRLRLAAWTVCLWSIISAMVLALFVLAFYRSTLADRLALFFIPLQLYAFSTLPSTFNPTIERSLTLIIVLGSGTTLWVWMTYGSHSQDWLPYRNLLLP